MSPKRIQRPNVVGSSLVQDTTGQAVAQGISGVGKQLGAISDALLKAKTDRDNATAKQMSSRDVTQDELKLKKYSNKLSADSEASGEWDDNADLMNAYQEKVYNERLASERGGNETYRQSYSTFYRLPATYAIGDVIRKQEAGRNRAMTSGLNEDLDQHISTMNAENFPYKFNMGLGVIDSYPSLNTKMMEELYSSKLSAHVLEMAKNPETSAEAIAIMNSPQGQDLFSGKSDLKKAVYAAADNSSDLYSAQAEAKLSVEMNGEKERLSKEIGNHTPIEVLVNEINSNPALDKAEKDELLAHIGQSKSGSSGSGSGSGSKLSQADTKKRYTSELGVLNTQLTEALKIDGTKDMRKEVNSVIKGLTRLESELLSGDLTEANARDMKLTIRTARQKALYALTDGKTVDTDPKRFLPLGQDHINKISRKANDTLYPYMNSMNLKQRQQYTGIFQRKLLQELDNYPKGDKIGEEESNALIKGLHEQSLMEMMGEENYEVFVNGKVKQAPSTNDADALTFYSNGLNAGMSHEQLAELFIENNNAPREQSEAQIGRVLNQIRMNEMQESADWQGPTQTAINPQSTYGRNIDPYFDQGPQQPSINDHSTYNIPTESTAVEDINGSGVTSETILDGEPAQLGRTGEIFSGVQSPDTFDGRIESEDLLDTRITQGDTVENKEQQNAQETKPKGSVNPDGSDFQYATTKKSTPKNVVVPEAELDKSGLSERRTDGVFVRDQMDAGGKIQRPQEVESALSSIASGESFGGSPDAMNQGTSGNKIIGSGKDSEKIIGKKLSSMTIGEVMKHQAKPKKSKDRVFAAGAYQIIPSTMKWAVDEMGISKDETFSAETQKEIAEYILVNKQPDVRRFIKGEHDDIDKAITGLAKEWASFPTPTGNSYYGSGNKAKHSVEDSRKILLALRESNK